MTSYFIWESAWSSKSNSCCFDGGIKVTIVCFVVEDSEISSEEAEVLSTSRDPSYKTMIL